MSRQQFTSLEIDFKQTDKGSVYYAHLQNLFKQLYLNHLQKSYDKEEILFKKVDKVLYDVYLQYIHVLKQSHSTSNNLKNIMQQFSTMINQFKTDREELVKVTQDRQNILQKLKQTTDQSLSILQQNQLIYQQLNKQKQQLQKKKEQIFKLNQLNLLFKQKNTVLQEQIMNLTTSNQTYENVVTMSKQFQKISNDNISIQQDIADILRSTEMYSNASEPLQIMCLAFQQNPKLRQQIWSQMLSRHSNKFENIQLTKSHFFNFNYVDALMLYSK